MAQPATDWSDFQWFVDSYLQAQTVATLKTFVDVVQNDTKQYLNVRSGERKADICHKLATAFRVMKDSNSLGTYSRTRYACELRGKHAGRPYPGPPPTFGGVPSTAANRYGSTSLYTSAAPRPTSNWTNTGSSSAILHNNPSPAMEDWKSGPMWKPTKALTTMTALPDIAATDTTHVRKERKVYFNLPTDVCEKLNQTKLNPAIMPQYSLRLFCTSSDHFRLPGTPIQPATAHITNRNIPIEYPTNPDFQVDDYHIRFTERGLRGKPGSAPPLDLNKTIRGLNLNPARSVVVTFGHSGPTTGKDKKIAKRLVFQILLVEWTPKEELMKRLEKLRPTDPMQSLALYHQQQDDDIVAGPSKMSLKDPLSYMRITQPVRSSKCSHLQCFEAKWWIEGNAQHPQWLCPHCSKELKFEDLMVDGYFLSILDAVPEEVEEVVMEGDGEWHTEDNKYGSTVWMASREQSVVAPKVERPVSPVKRATPPHQDSPDTKGKRKAIEILSSDDEEEDEDVPLRPNGFHRPLAKRITSAAHSDRTRPSASVQPPPSGSGGDVIDLTLSSDDEEELPNFHRPSVESASRGVVDSYLPIQNPIMPYDRIAAFNNTNHAINGDSTARWQGATSSSIDTSRRWDTYSTPPHLSAQLAALKRRRMEEILGEDTTGERSSKRPSSSASNGADRGWTSSYLQFDLDPSLPQYNVSAREGPVATNPTELLERHYRHMGKTPAQTGPVGLSTLPTITHGDTSVTGPPRIQKELPALPGGPRPGFPPSLPAISEHPEIPVTPPSAATYGSFEWEEDDLAVLDMLAFAEQG